MCFAKYSFVPTPQPRHTIEDALRILNKQVFDVRNKLYHKGLTHGMINDDWTKHITNSKKTISGTTTFAQENDKLSLTYISFYYLSLLYHI